MVRTTVLFILGAIVAACSSPVASPTGEPSTEPATSASPSDGVPTPSPTEESVVCEWFAADGVRQKFIEAFASSATGDQTMFHETLRVAIAANEELASRASGQEQHDLLALADAVANMADDPLAWRLLVDEFYGKYAEQCGTP